MSPNDWLRLCCADESACRPEIERPWVHDGHVYATDVVSLHRRPHRDLDRLPERDKGCPEPPIESAVQHFAGRPDAEPREMSLWDAVRFAGPQAIPVACSTCGGAGLLGYRIHDEVGEPCYVGVDSDNAHEATDVSCCHACDGEGTEPPPLEPVELCGVKINSLLLARTLWALRAMDWQAQGLRLLVWPGDDRLWMQYGCASALVMCCRGPIERRFCW